jgi:NAD(P)-dependent dehydrogenase (short-subunit alcohol dehydrogenase family)
VSSISFDGQVAVITGAGRGIGRAHALELGRRGAAVVVNDLAREHADEVVSAIEASGGTAVASYDTVATPEGGKAIIGAATDRFGTIDILVNNAGILRPAYFEDLTLQQLDQVFDTHLRAAFFVTQPAWPVMKEKGYGRVIMTSSNSGLFSHGGNSNYAAAKAGIYGLTKALAYEGAAHGITCNAVLPMAETTISKENPIPGLEEDRGRLLDASDLELMSVRREPRLVAQLVVYLASRECEVSGLAFSAAGGRYARVFVGIAEGWLAEDTGEATVEAIGEHFDEICDIAEHTTPMWLFDEYADVVRRLRATV